MKLSVLVCTYNGEKYIKEQLDSILNQTRPIDEIVVSDDNSSDNTVSHVRSIFEGAGFNNYKIIVNNPGKGVAKNFLDGLRETSGDYVFLSDQDDIWDKRKVEVFEQYFKKSRGIAFFSDGVLIDSMGKRLPGSLWETIPFTVTMLNKHSLLSLMLNRSIVTGSAMAISRDLIAQCNINKVPEGWIHDDLLGFIAASQDAMIPINDKLYYYRQHENNVVGAAKLNFFQKINKWVDSIEGISYERVRRYKKYKSVLPYCSEKYLADLKQCIAFWKKMCELNNASSLKASKIIIHEKKGYSKYYTGFRGQLKDILSAVIK